MPVVIAKNAPDLTANTGMTRTPTTLVSVRPGPGNCVCFWNHTIARWTPISARMIPGSSRMCSPYRRGMMMPVAQSYPAPPQGKSPPNSAQCNQVPITGMPSVIEDSAARSPMPDSRSSGSE